MSESGERIDDTNNVQETAGQADNPNSRQGTVEQTGDTNYTQAAGQIDINYSQQYIEQSSYNYLWEQVKVIFKLFAFITAAAVTY